MSDESKECWQCRLVSGSGLICAGTYVVHHAKKFKGFQKQGITLIGYGLGLIGALRLIGLPPFRTDTSHDKTMTDKRDEDEYIIGKFTSRYN